MTSMHMRSGEHTTLVDVYDGDLVKLSSGKLAMRKEFVTETMIAVAYCNGMSPYGDYTYTQELLPYDTDCQFVLSREILYSILLRAQDVRDLIDTYLSIGQQMHYTYQEDN